VVRQTSRGADIAVRASAELDVQGLGRELGEDLTRLGITQPQVTVSIVDEIKRSDGTGKIRRVVPLASKGR
jgi:phenylacetate-CoA ligase